MEKIRAVRAVLITLLRQKALWLATGRNGILGFAGFRKDAPRLAAGCFTIALVVMFASAVTCQAAWEGVDVNVVEKFAEKAGRPPRTPLINTDQGDLLLFVFLLAGITGGFVGGYLFRGLFAPPKRPKPEAPHDG